MRRRKLSVAVVVLAGSLLTLACAYSGAEPTPPAGDPAATPPGTAAEATCRDAAAAATFARGGLLRRRVAVGKAGAADDGVPLCADAPAPKTAKQGAPDLSLRRRHAEPRSND